MDINAALAEVMTTYQNALKTNKQAKQNGYGPIIHNPVAWALYVVWFKANKEKPRKEDE